MLDNFVFSNVWSNGDVGNEKMFLSMFKYLLNYYRLDCINNLVS